MDGIDSVWLDTRSAANNTDSQFFYSYSRDGGNDLVAQHCGEQFFQSVR